MGGIADDTADSGAQHAAVSSFGGAGGEAALAQLRHHNAALYQVFVQQQLLAAQTLLATASMVLSQRLPVKASTVAAC